MAAPGSRATTSGLALMVIAVGSGVSSSGGFALLLSFAGVLAGASLIFIGVRLVAKNPTAHIGRPGVQVHGEYFAAPPPAVQRMATRGSSSTSRAAATGLALTMIAVAVGVSSSGGFALLLSFAGVLAGASLIFVGVRIADESTAPTICPGVLAAIVRAVQPLVHCLRRNLALMGLLLASSATAAVDRETVPVLCFCAFSLLLLGLSVVNVGVLLLGEQEQEHWFFSWCDSWMHSCPLDS